MTDASAPPRASSASTRIALATQAELLENYLAPTGDALAKLQ